ncbi:isoprenylcysteine carboxylmethyltransferase family protein [Candidatus Bathyarchaeota archaeon]|nr:isoprenylcysteine carboxylmethyltransferase family protein [Candidatus Bathyarchaeota archaeon]
MTRKSSEEAKVAAVKQGAVSSVMLLIQIAIYFLSAGYVGVRPWIFFAASFLHYVVSIGAQYKLNPELLAARLVVKRKGSKTWDEILMRASNLVVLIGLPVAAGLDVGRFGWSSLDVTFMIPGFILLGFSTLVLNWAMATNPFFEPTVRIQTDRSHKVITKGPYGFVRHPGYLAGLLYVFSFPLIVGSAFAIVAAGIYTVLITLRTSLEDKTLSRELAGYAEYSKKVRYKLFPWIL